MRHAWLLILFKLTFSAYGLEKVFDENFPDPTVLAAPDGRYYAYATQGEGFNQAGRPEFNNVQVLVSPDLQNWRRLPDAMPNKPKWAKGRQNFWAPDVIYRDGTYYLYFSSDAEDQDGFCVGVAMAKNPQGPYEPTDQPVICGKGISNIDPAAFDDPATGARLLYIGSGHESLRVIRLTHDRLRWDRRSVEREVLYPTDRKYQTLIEGSWVMKRGRYYYLFYSGDNCCHGDPHYAVLVARSLSPYGPFEKKPGSVALLEGNERWLAPGHNSVVQDRDGQFWIFAHAIDRKRPHDFDEFPDRVLVRIRLDFQEGWPVIDSDYK